MKFWVHKIKENKGRRFFFHLWTKDDKRIFDYQIEVYHRMKELSFKLHFGNRGSETPFDGYFCIPFLQLYWGMDFNGLGRICEIIGFGKKRDLSLSIHGGHLWWNLWFDNDMGYDRYHECDGWRTIWWWPFSWYRKKYRSWACLRDGNIELNPWSAIWGIRFYSYEDLETATRWVRVDQFPTDEYSVDFTLQRMTQARRHGPWPFNRKTDRGLIVKWFCNPGIPTRNHDWKGDNILGSSFRLDPEREPEPWDDVAVDTLIDWVKKQRIRRNYHPPIQEEV